MKTTTPSISDPISVRLLKRNSRQILVENTQELMAASRFSQVLFLSAAAQWLGELAGPGLTYHDPVFEQLAKTPLPELTHSTPAAEVLASAAERLGKMGAYSAQELLAVATELAGLLAPPAKGPRARPELLKEWFAGKPGPADMKASHKVTTRQGGGGAIRIYTFRKLEEVLALPSEQRSVVVSGLRTWLTTNDPHKRAHHLDHEQLLALKFEGSRPAPAIDRAKYAYLQFMLNSALPAVSQPALLAVLPPLAAQVYPASPLNTGE